VVRTANGTEKVVARWRQSGRAVGMTERKLDQFADAFEHRERNTVKAVTQAAG
jgi:serine/threonine-protein kinase HipA